MRSVLRTRPLPGFRSTIACGSMASTMLPTSTWSITILGPRPKSSCNAQAMEARPIAAPWARQLTLRPSRASVLLPATSRGKSRWTTAVAQATAICTRSLSALTIPWTIHTTVAPISMLPTWAWPPASVSPIPRSRSLTTRFSVVVPVRRVPRGPVSATNTHWNVFVAESVNGHAVSPVFTVSQATDHSNHTGQISTGGLLGSSDRSLADFFQIGIDPNHLVNIAYADNHAGTSVTYFTRERTATSGIATGGKCAGTAHEAGGKGHVNGKHGGQAQFSFNYDDSTQQAGSASFSDSGSGVNFQATKVASATFDEVAHTVALIGSGTNNGLRVTFTIIAADSSLAAPGLFSITLSDAYNNSGNLLDGSITVY